VLEGDAVAERWRSYSNLAFMALGIEDEPLYVSLSDRALLVGSERGSERVLTMLTRALWEATHGEYEQALKRLADANTVPGPWEEDAYMYSPAVLARNPAVIVYDDLVGTVDLESVATSYREAVAARAGGGSVADSLAAIDGAQRWVILAAARAADFEERPQLAGQLRESALEIDDV
jgi:hypothetical protein